MAGCTRRRGRALSPGAWLGLVSALACPASSLAAAPFFRGALYDHPAAGSETWREPRQAVACNGDISIYNTREPQIEVFLPEPAKRNGAAVVMLPGGGLRVLGVGAESDAEVEAFLSHGVA